MKNGLNCTLSQRHTSLPEPLPPIHTLIRLPHPGRWPLTNMCSSFWTSVGLGPVAFAASLTLRLQSSSMAGDLACPLSLPQPSISIITCKIALNVCPPPQKKLDQARQAKDQGHQMHGMKNYMVITLETIMTGGLHTLPLVGAKSGWMDGW